MNNPTPESLQLEPCPFCGSERQFEFSIFHHIGCVLRKDTAFKSTKEITKAWNTRANIQKPLPNKHSGEAVSMGCTELVKALKAIAEGNSKFQEDNGEAPNIVIDSCNVLVAQPNYKEIAGKLAGSLEQWLNSDSWETDCIAKDASRKALAAYNALTSGGKDA